jgi:pimeloyl-ACP methyl ester carboxylesterase
MPGAARLESFDRDDLRFDVIDQGPLTGPPVVLLHGFPQDCSCWRSVTALLNAAGYRTLAPDQRGYSPRARPQGRGAYRQRELVEDVIALLDAADIERVHLVGHDWGGFVAWAVAATHPDRLAAMTVLSTPHPAAFMRSMLRGQALRSWYMAAVQLPVLPEQALRPGSRVWQSLRKGVGAQAADQYRRRLSEPGAVTAALNWYRALPADVRNPSVRVGSIAVPTQYVWGEKDPFLGREAAERTAEYVRGAYRFRPLPRAGHWLPERNGEQVAQLVLDWSEEVG